MVNFIYILNAEIKSIGCCVRNVILWCLPNTWCANHYLRPFVLKLLGMQCGRRITIGRGIYYGGLRNIQIGDETFINENVLFNAYGKITIHYR